MERLPPATGVLDLHGRAWGSSCNFWACWFASSPVDQLYWLFGVAMGMPAFYALGCGATMFAGEHETGTFDFQRGMPVSAKRFFWSNILFGALSTAAMIAVLFVAALCFCRIFPLARQRIVPGTARTVLGFVLFRLVGHRRPRTVRLGRFFLADFEAALGRRDARRGGGFGGLATGDAGIPCRDYYYPARTSTPESGGWSSWPRWR